MTHSSDLQNNLTDEQLTLAQIRTWCASLTQDLSTLDKVLGDLAAPLGGFNRIVQDPTGQAPFTQTEQQGIARAVQIMLPDFGTAPNEAERKIYTDTIYATGAARNVMERLSTAIAEVNHQIDWVVNCEQAQILQACSPDLFANLSPLSILFGQAVRSSDYIQNQQALLSEMVQEIQDAVTVLAANVQDIPRDLLDKTEALEQRWQAFSNRESDETSDPVNPSLLEQEGITTRIFLSVAFGQAASQTLDQLIREIACKGAILNMDGWVDAPAERIHLAMGVLTEADAARSALGRFMEGNAILHAYLDAQARPS